MSGIPPRTDSGGQAPIDSDDGRHRDDRLSKRNENNQRFKRTVVRVGGGSSFANVPPFVLTAESRSASKDACVDGLKDARDEAIAPYFRPEKEARERAAAARGDLASVLTPAETVERLEASARTFSEAARMSGDQSFEAFAGLMQVYTQMAKEAIRKGQDFRTKEVYMTTSGVHHLASAFKEIFGKAFADFPEGMPKFIEALKKV